jgi:hypothetical protein
VGGRGVETSNIEVNGVILSGLAQGVAVCDEEGVYWVDARGGLGWVGGLLAECARKRSRERRSDKQDSSKSLTIVVNSVT